VWRRAFLGTMAGGLLAAPVGGPSDDRRDLREGGSGAMTRQRYISDELTNFRGQDAA
jgi:hypothetical protein